MTHIIKLLFQDVLNCGISITDNLKEFNSAKGVKINYTALDIKDAIKIVPNGLLFETGIRHKKVTIGTWHSTTTLFPNEEVVIPFDLFSASFYLTSRYEEHTDTKRDHYNRFLPEESIAFKNNFLQKPLVNIWVKQLQLVVEEKFSGVSFPKRKYEFISTIDVDNAYAYKGKGMVRTLGALSRSLLTFNFDDFTNRAKCLLGIIDDPFDSFDKQFELQRKYQFKAIYFFLVGDYGLNDKNVPISSRKFQSLIKHVSDYTAIGVHPSFASNKEPERVKMETDRLAKVVHIPITKSRQHFLTLSFPETYKTLMDNGITDDYTMGYASMMGFRASICSAYSYYNFDTEQTEALTIHPFSVMEATIRHYMNEPVEKAMAYILPIINEVKEVNGTLTVLWHNDSLSELPPWEGWSGLYEEMVKAAV
ncbi:MAG: polysaccharide deacetylase family protein [Flavobacteriales bacterium]|nr:polysaccharide deacetylase family protein [Flavobacteriales bacterium]